MRRPTTTLLSALAVAGLLLAGCGGDDDGDTADETTTTVAPATTEAAADVDCASYTTVFTLVSQTEEIATGSFDGQTAADAALAEAIAALEPSAVDDDELVDSLAVLGQLSFQVAEAPDEAPAPGDVDSALEALEAAWGEQCAPEPTVPDPTVGSDEDSEQGEGTGASTVEEAPRECPAPEVLESEGYTCDSEGNLTPVEDGGDGTVTECPAPEVLESEGYTCDSEGNLTPVE